jgi:hypothetical protein
MQQVSNHTYFVCSTYLFFGLLNFANAFEGVGQSYSLDLE